MIAPCVTKSIQFADVVSVTAFSSLCHSEDFLS